MTTTDPTPASLTREPSDPYVCTAEAPWTPEKGRRAMHPDAVSGDDIDYGLGCNCATYRCPHCGEYFEVELPQ